MNTATHSCRHAEKDRPVGCLRAQSFGRAASNRRCEHQYSAYHLLGDRNTGHERTWPSSEARGLVRWRRRPTTSKSSERSTPTKARSGTWGLPGRLPHPAPHDDGRQERQAAHDPAYVRDRWGSPGRLRLRGRIAEQPRLVPQPGRPPGGGRGDRRGVVRGPVAVVTEGAECERLWELAVASNPPLGGYPEKMDRRIPLITLEQHKESEGLASAFRGII